MATISDPETSLAQAEYFDYKETLADVKGSITVDEEGEERGLLYDELPPGNGSLIGAVFNICNTIVGGGLLSLPKAFAESGLLVGILLLLLVACLSLFTSWCMLKAGAHCRQYTFKRVLSSFGRFWGYFGELGICLLMFGAMCCYLIIIGDYVPALFGAWVGQKFFLAQRPIAMAIVVVAILFPLTIPRKIDMLKYPSLGAMLAMLLTMVVVITRFANKNNHQFADYPPIRVGSSMFMSSFSVFMFGFGFQSHVLPIYSELKVRTIPRAVTAIVLALVFVVVLYSCVGIFGYLTFGNKVAGNILQSYDQKDVLVQVAKCGMIFVACMSYPLIAFVARRCIELSFFEYRKFSWIRHIVIAIILHCCAYGLAIGVGSHLDYGVKFISATIVSTMFLILPPVAVLFLLRHKWTTRRKVATIALTLFITAAAVAAFVTIVVSTIQGALKKHGPHK